MILIYLVLPFWAKKNKTDRLHHWLKPFSYIKITEILPESVDEDEIQRQAAVNLKFFSDF